MESDEERGKRRAKLQPILTDGRYCSLPVRGPRVGEDGPGTAHFSHYSLLFFFSHLPNTYLADVSFIYFFLLILDSLNS